MASGSTPTSSARSTPPRPGGARGDRGGSDRPRATRSPLARGRPPARPGAARRSRPAGARCPTASATSPCAPRCRGSAARWSTGGSTGTRATRCATASGTRAAHRRQLARAAGRAPARRPTGATVHHPVEDVGTGVVHARIAFCAPTRARLLDRRARRPATSATIVCGYVGDDRRHVRHTPMVARVPARRRRRRAAQPLLARRGDPPVPARRRSARAGGARCSTGRAVRRRALPAAAAARRSPATAPRSTRTWPRCCPSCTRALGGKEALVSRVCLGCPSEDADADDCAVRAPAGIAGCGGGSDSSSGSSES